MKFDCVIGNPPYDRSLHLKILKEVMKHVDFENGGEIVWLAPDTNMHNPATWLDWNKNGLCEYLYSRMSEVDFISHEDANKIFELGNGIDSLHIGKYIGKICNSKSPFNDDFLKIIKTISSSKPNLRSKFIRKENLSKFGLRIFRYHSGDTVYSSIVCEEGRAVEGIDFKNQIQQDNFKKSLDCWPYKFMFCINDTNPAHLPFMGSAVNPRTGKLGYESEWTDADFYAYFKLTPEEIKVIEDTMKKYSK